MVTDDGRREKLRAIVAGFAAVEWDNGVGKGQVRPMGHLALLHCIASALADLETCRWGCDEVEVEKPAHAANCQKKCA